MCLPARYAPPPTAAARRSGRRLNIVSAYCPMGTGGPLARVSAFGQGPAGRVHDPGAAATTLGLLCGAVTAVQGVLEFLLVVLGQGRLQDRAAVLAHRLDGLVGGDLLEHQEQRRGAGLEHAA